MFFPGLVLFLALISTGMSVSADESKEPASDSFIHQSLLFLQDEGLAGSLRFDYFSSSKTFDNKRDFLGETAQIKLRPVFGDGLDGKIEARLTHPDINNEDGTDGTLLEGYLTAHFAHADLRIGKQIVAWGRADGINPTDNLTPRDFTVLLPFEDDQRFGTSAVKLDAFLSPEHTLTVFVSPFFEPSKIPFPTGTPLKETKPAHTLSNTEVGLKLNKAGEGFDGSISVFRGFSLLPDMRLAGPSLESHHDRITVLGADFARNVGRLSVRGEAAYVDTADDAGTDLGTQNPFLYWIAGVDRTFLDNLNLNVQFFQRRVWRYHDPENSADPAERDIAIQNAVIAGQRDRINNGLSVRASNKWLDDTLEAEIFAAFNLTRKDSFWRPLLNYALSDQWKAAAGAEYYRGADDTQFGSLKTNRGVFAEMRFGF